MRAHAPQYIAAFVCAWIFIAGIVRSVERGAWYDVTKATLKSAVIMFLLTWGGFFKS